MPDTPSPAPETLDAIAYGLLAITLIGAAVTDCRTGQIFNRWTYPAIALGLVYWLLAGLLGAERGGTQALLALAAGLIPFALIRQMGGLGGGDVKLMAAVGALSASWQVVLATTVYAMLLAALMAVALMIRHGLIRQTLQRLWGAALSTGARVKPALPDDSPHVPFGAAVALGGLLAGIEQMLGLTTPWAWLGP